MKQCPYCENISLKSWPELSEAERRVAENRPTPDYQDWTHRQQHHYWCTRCWCELHGCGERYA